MHNVGTGDAGRGAGSTEGKQARDARNNEVTTELLQLLHRVAREEFNVINAWRSWQYLWSLSVPWSYKLYNRFCVRKPFLRRNISLLPSLSGLL